MVFLSRIYTKTGDKGETGLGDGSRVPKDHPRVTAYGGVDELNAVLGLLPAPSSRRAEADLLRSIQNDLFDVGADLCVPQPADEAGRGAAARPAGTSDAPGSGHRPAERDLSPLTSFVLAGRRPAAAWCHLARTVCRRAERDVVTLAHASRSIPRSSFTSTACPTSSLCWPASTTITARTTCSGSRASRNNPTSRHPAASG